MVMIPSGVSVTEENGGLVNDFEYENQPSYTYKLNIESERIGGYVDGLEAYKQAIYKVLNTERYDYLIYSWNYGVELRNLIGQQIAYVIPEIEWRITEAVMADDRTISVGDFEFDTSKRGVVHVTFRAKSQLGTVTIEKDVEI